MSNFTRCRKCSEYIWPDSMRPHKCKPAWLVWDPEYGDADDALTMYCRDAQDAAEQWAELDDCNSADYAIVGGTPCEVRVRSKENESDLAQVFVVSGETQAVYSAREVTP